MNPPAGHSANVDRALGVNGGSARQNLQADLNLFKGVTT